MIVLDQVVVDENNIAFHPALGNSYQLNETGALIINLIKQHKNLDEILDIISKEYNVDKKELFIDMQDFITKLKIYGLYQ